MGKRNYGEKIAPAVCRLLSAVWRPLFAVCLPRVLISTRLGDNKNQKHTGNSVFLGKNGKKTSQIP
jgi:hypothetical protein